MRGERNGDASVSLVEIGVGGINRDLQVHNTVAAERGLFTLRVVKGPGYVSGECESIFVVWLKLANSVNEFRSNVRVHDEMQDGGAVAAVHVGVSV